jgi:hypothetical protein
MNLKTTLALLVLVAAGAVLFWSGFALPPALDPAPRPAPVVDKGTRAILDHLKSADLIAIEVRRGDEVTSLRRPKGGPWSMPGQWPPRQAEVQALADQLAGLHSRFEPIPVPGSGDAGTEKLREYGLDKPAVTVKLETENDKHTLEFGEGRETNNEIGEGRETNNETRFSRPTYLRLDHRDEVVRLGPGLVAVLDRPTDYYQQRRLFPGERVAKEGDAENREKVERLAASRIAIKEGKKDGLDYSLVRNQGTWELSQPTRDRLDPRPLEALLAAVPDIWAEQFVGTDARAVTATLPLALFWTTPRGLLARTGLADPQRTLAVTSNDGSTVTLLIGNAASSRSRKVLRPQPPGLPPGLPPREETVVDEYRYAKLQDNDQVFEIKAEKLKDVFVPLTTLRDPQVARFNSADAARLEISHAGQKIVLAKEKDNWKLLEPLQAEADSSKVTDLLSKLSGLEARDQDVIDKAKPEDYGLKKPSTTITVTVEEEDKKEGEDRGKDTSKDKPKKKRTLTVLLGKHDAQKKKLYIQAEGWPRVNAVEDSLVPLVDRPALAYRGKRVFDFAESDVAKLDVRRGDQVLTLEQGPDGWRLAAPVRAEADAPKVGQLTGGLGALEALEYVKESPAKEDLEGPYGLGKPALEVTVTFKDAEKPARTLQLGKARGGKPGYFAKLADAPAVFAVNNDLHNLLERDALAYRPLQLWQVPAADVTGLRVHKAGQDEYRLTRAGAGWQISGPFEATAQPDAAHGLATALAAPNCERYQTHQAKDLAAYGLDKPALTVTLTAKAGKEHTLLIGGPVPKEDGARYAKLAKAPAVFVVGRFLFTAADRAALDLLDPVLLHLDPGSIQRIDGQSGEQALKLERKGEGWQVLDAPGAPFTADERAGSALATLWLNLRAERYAAYGPKVDWAKYGLDKPAATVTAHAGDKVEHTVRLGAEVEGEAGARYARVDKGPGVAVLGPGVAKVLARTYLDYVDHNVLQFDAGAVKLVQRHMGPDVFEVVKQDDGWQIAKPAQERADDQAVQDLLGRLADLRASRIAAYPAKDLGPFGLDKPQALVTVQLGGDTKPGEHIIKLGKVADPATGARFALVDSGKAVAVLPPDVAGKLTAGPLAFRERTLARFADAERVRLQRGLRKAVFAKVDGSWKLVEPLEADADQEELDDFINTLAKLRADELVAEKPAAAELKKYGLDRPEVTYRLQSGDKDVLALQVGNRESKGPRRYARLAGRDLVFLLDRRLSDKVMGEFRQRTVWASPPDAAQVDSLRYGFARKPFTLERGAGGDWQVAGKPDAKVNAMAVNETLSALAGLKLARYAVDKGADPGLFGLDKPELVLEVATRTGKHTLQIGGFVGESKDRYARVPEAGRTDVFVLDEATCARLVHDLAAFTRPAPARAAAPSAGGSSDSGQ